MLIERILRRLEIVYARLRSLDQWLTIRDQLVQNWSHELRTPLTMILGYAEHMAAGALGELNSHQKAALDIIVRRVGDILDIHAQSVAIMYGRMGVIVEPVEIRPILLNALGDFSLEAEKKDITLTHQLDDGTVLGNVMLLRRVVEELVDNAIKFTPTGGRVFVAGYVVGRGYTLSVSDNGIGIPENEMGKIFEMGYQVDGSPTRIYPGVGMGLYAVAEALRPLGGRIEVKSQEGEGSTFTVWLPTGERELF